jgi:hypothetical protein
MLSTASGHFPKDFSNTKMIQGGKIISLNEMQTQSTSTAPTEHNQQKDMASFDQAGNATYKQGSLATDIGLFKAGMDTCDQQEVKKVIADSSHNSEFYKTQESRLRLVE